MFTRILISGASSGIGEALAYECVKRGAKALFLCGRNAERLNAVAEKCRGISAACEVHADVVDVTDEAATRAWIERSNAIAPLELVFANAGVATGAETEANIRTTFATNVGGVLNVSLPAIAAFRANGCRPREDARLTMDGGPRGDARLTVEGDGAARSLRPTEDARLTMGGDARPALVMTASIAGYAPLSGCPSYSGTKACIKTWGLAMRGMLKKEGINVSVVCPGFIRSRMTDVNTCPMPFFMEADKAARIILDRVERNIGLIAFPWPMRLAVWSLSCLPARITEFIASLLPAKIKRQGVVTDGRARTPYPPSAASSEGGAMRGAAPCERNVD